MSQEQIQKRTAEKSVEEYTEEQNRTIGAGAIKSDGLDQHVDELLDEIDDVLEENAEQFVRSFVQKGGQ